MDDDVRQQTTTDDDTDRQRHTTTTEDDFQQLNAYATQSQRAAVVASEPTSNYTCERTRATM